MEPNMSPRIFISYKRVNKEKVFQLKELIEAATDEKCWVDLDGIESDDQFANVITKAIDVCNIVLFMHSSEHLRIVESNRDKDWTCKELHYAEDNGKRIVVIRLDNAMLKGTLNLLYGLKQQVDANNPHDLAKLYKDIKAWLKDIDKRSIGDKDNQSAEIDIDIDLMIEKFELVRKYTYSDSKQKQDERTILLKESIDSFSKLAARGNANAQFYLGQCYDFDFIAGGKEKAFQWYKISARHGNSDAQYAIGRLYYFGYLSVLADYDKAFEWFFMSAENGNAEAQFRLGQCYLEGKGVIKNLNEAAQWYRKAAEQGLAKSQFYLGLRYEKGEGVPQDYAKAAEWYAKAAEQNYPLAEESLKRLVEL